MYVERGNFKDVEECERGGKGKGEEEEKRGSYRTKKKKEKGERKTTTTHGGNEGCYSKKHQCNRIKAEGEKKKKINEELTPIGVMRKETVKKDIYLAWGILADYSRGRKKGQVFSQKGENPATTYRGGGKGKSLQRGGSYKNKHRKGGGVGLKSVTQLVGA